MRAGHIKLVSLHLSTTASGHSRYRSAWNSAKRHRRTGWICTRRVWLQRWLKGKRLTAVLSDGTSNGVMVRYGGVMVSAHTLGLTTPTRAVLK